MSKGLHTSLAAVLPPLGLYERICAHLAAVRQRRARQWLAVQSVMCFGFGLLLVPTAQYAGAELYASGFTTYASLLFSDHAVFGSSREFAYSLIDSLPSIALLLVVAVCAALLWSLYQVVTYSRIAFPTTASTYTL